MLLPKILCSLPLLSLFCWADPVYEGPIEKSIAELQATTSENLKMPMLTASTTRPVNFTALSLKDSKSAFPDSMGAVGPTQYIAFCNGRVRSFEKASGGQDGVLDLSPDHFFAFLLPDGYKTAQPRIKYDQPTGSWFVIMLGHKGNDTPDKLLVGVAQDSTITSDTVWSFYSFEPAVVSPARSSPTDTAYFPTLGIDVNALYIGLNFLNSSGDFLNSDAFVIPKTPLLSSTLNVYPFRNLVDASTSVGLYTPQGVDNFDTDATDGFFIGVNLATSGSLILRRVEDPGTSPTLSDNLFLSVAETASPLTVPHQGNTKGPTGNLDAMDERLSQAHIRNHHLYTAHNLATNAKGVSDPSLVLTANGCRWYEIDLTDPAHPSLVQEGTLYDPLPNDFHRRHFWIPSLLTNGLNTIAIGCSTAGIYFFIDSAYAVHYTTDPLGSLRAPTLYTRSTTSYNPPADQGGPLGRKWGGVSSLSLDPEDNLTLWSIQEFCDATNSYGCQVTSILAAPPPPATSCSPSLLSRGYGSIVLNISAPASNGSACYDPPVGFPKHLRIKIGDLPIQSTTLVSPEKIRVSVSTRGVSKGEKTIEIINPDGQISSTEHLLTVY